MSAVALAIAAESFSKPSETFIRDHARTIAPGQTVLLCQDGPEAQNLALDTLAALDIGGGPGAGDARRYWRRYLRPKLPATDIERAADFLLAHRPHALMTEYGFTGVMLAEAAKRAGVPLYAHFHGFDASVMTQLPFWKGRYRGLFAAAEGVIAPSKFITNKLAAIGCPEEKLHVCACGIDPKRFKPSVREPGRLVSVGRLVEKKAPHLAIAAFGMVAMRFPDARLDIVGAGPLESKCRRAIERLGLQGRVTLHGRQSHEFVATLMGSAAIFVQHSVTSALGDVEGLPVSVLEAMAAEIPVVATRHSGISEAVLEGETGLLVEERDVSGMAAAIAELLLSPARSEMMGSAGRARVLSRYTHEKSAETLREIMRLPGPN